MAAMRLKSRARGVRHALPGRLRIGLDRAQSRTDDVPQRTIGPDVVDPSRILRPLNLEHSELHQAG